MKPLYAAMLVPLIVACTPPGTSTDTTRVVNTVPAEDMAACVARTAEDAGVPQALVTVTDFRPETTGPALTMDANGRVATCKLNTEGEVTSLTFS